MTDREILLDLLPGCTPEEDPDGGWTTETPAGDPILVVGGLVYWWRGGAPDLMGVLPEQARAELHATATAWMDAILGPLTDGELVDVADPNAHYTDGREVGPLRSFDITPRMKRTLANMPDGGKLIVGDAVWSRVPKEASNGVLDYVVAANAEEWADYMALRNEATDLQIARFPLLTRPHVVRVGVDGKILPPKETP